MAKGLSAALVLAMLALGSQADAGQCDNPLVSTCINSDSLWPTPGPLRFVGVAGTETVAQGQVAFGMVATYQSRPILLNVATPGPGGSDQPVIDNQVNDNFLFSYGVTNRLQLDFVMPVTLVQTGAGTSPITGGGSLKDTAVRDLRFGLAYAIVPRVRAEPIEASRQGGPGKAWSLTARFATSAPTGDNGDFAGERSAVFVPSLAADYRYGRLFFGGELGMRIRPVTEFTGARVGTQVKTAAGAGFDVLSRELLAVVLEGRAYWNFAEQHETSQSAFGITSRPRSEDRFIVPAEWMLGVRSAPLLGGDLSFYAGGGGPLPLGPDAITVPRFRFVLGASYTPTARDSDGDGIPDRFDLCPHDKGPRGTERPGCPTSRADKQGPEGPEEKKGP